MRKRPSRPNRFAAIDNNAIDTLPSILAIGLLTRLVRAKDGDDVTVETLTQDYSEGRKSLEGAMRILVQAGNVVKFKVQSIATDGNRRGGSWATAFTVDSIPFTREDVAAMLKEILDEGNVRAIRIEPEHLDPRKARPTAPKRPVGPTCGNSDEDDVSAGGTDRSVTDGRSTDRRSGGGYIRSKTSSSLSQTEAPVETETQAGEREDQEDNGHPAPASPVASVPAQATGEGSAHPGADQVVAAYAKASGKPVTRIRAQLITDATEALAAGLPLHWVEEKARECAARGWTDLALHISKSPAPKAARPAAAAPAQGQCIKHPHLPEDCTECIAEQRKRPQRGPSDESSIGAMDIRALIARR